MAVERGWVTCENTLADWMLGLGEHALSKLDLPLLQRAHAARLSRFGVDETP